MPISRRKRKTSAKFERCVLAVKRKNSQKPVRKRVNPWAICHYSLNRRNKSRSKPTRKRSRSRKPKRK